MSTVCYFLTYVFEALISLMCFSEKFDKKVFSYKYTGGKVTAIPEDENSEVSMIESDNSVVIMVKSPSGEIGTYTLILSKINVVGIIVYILLGLGIVASAIVGYNVAKKKYSTEEPTKKEKKKKDKKGKLDNKNQEKTES